MSAQKCQKTFPKQKKISADYKSFAIIYRADAEFCRDCSFALKCNEFFLDKYHKILAAGFDSGGGCFSIRRRFGQTRRRLVDGW